MRMDHSWLIGLALLTGALVIALVGKIVFGVGFLTALALVIAGIVVNGLVVAIGKSKQRGTDG